jgi:hypothetical protein
MGSEVNIHPSIPICGLKKALFAPTILEDSNCHAYEGVLLAWTLALVAAKKS